MTFKRLLHRRSLRSSVPASVPTAVVFLALCGLLVAPAMGQTKCVVPDNGGGTVDLPPAGCGYVSPTDLHRMISGLPPGSTIRVAAEHNRFFNVTRTSPSPLGGEREDFGSFLALNMKGTGA